MWVSKGDEVIVAFPFRISERALGDNAPAGCSLAPLAIA